MNPFNISPTPKSQLKRNLLIFTVIILAVFLFWTSIEFENLFYRIVSFFEQYANEYKVIAAGVFVVLAILSTMLASFSSIWLVPIAVPIFGNALTTILLLAGWYLGSIFSYLIGRYAGFPIVARFVSSQKIDYYRDMVFEGREGFGLILLARFVLPSEIPGYVLGMARYNFGKYFLATVVAEIPYALAAVYAIDAIITKNLPMLLLWAGIWLISASGMFYVFYLRIRKKHVSE